MKSALLVVLPFVAVVSAAQAPEPKPPAAPPPAASAPPPAATAPKPRPEPTPAPAIEGTVRTPDGRPVERALVLVEPAGPSLRYRGVIVGRTDAAGKFRIVLTRPGSHRLRVEAPGWAAATVKDAGPGAVVIVTLRKGETIEGTLFDGTTGAPLPNATVEASDENNRVYAPWQPGAGTVRASTNAKGQFHLEGLAPGLHTVSAYLRGFNRAQRASVPSGGRVDLYAFAGAVLSGVVRDALERPVAGAVVRVEGERRGWSASAPAVAADADGRYEVAGLSPGTVRVVARHPEFAPTWVPGVNVERGGEAQIDVVMHRGARVSGRLVTGEDRPVSGRVDLQETEDHPVPGGLEDVFRGDAGEDGRFQVTLPPGEHVLAVVAPGYAPRRVEVGVGTAGNPVDVGDVRLEPGLAIRGSVRDKAGQPVAGARIFGHLSRMMSRSSTEATSEADGSFVLAGLDAGTYRVSVSARGYAEQLKQVEAGATADVVLAPAATISGMVVDDAGQAIESFRVAARADREMAPTGPSPRMDSFASADGRFVLEDVPEGTWVVEASAPDRANGVAPAVRVQPGGNVDVGRIRLPAGGIVRGMVVDTGGAAVAGASVTIQAASTDWMSGSRDASSDPGGAFEIRGVQAGAAEVVAHHPGYAQSQPVTVEVEPTRPPAEVRLVVSEGGRIEGRVLRRDGSGMQAVVTASAASPGARRGFWPLSSVNTAADGTFVLEHVPAGRVGVMVMAGAGGILESSHMREVEVREGETTTVEFVARDILVSGHVTRGGAPAPGLRLQLINATGRTVMSVGGAGGGVSAPPVGPQRLTAVTDEAGAYAMLADSPGKHYVNVTSVDGKLSLPSRPVEIPDADSFRVDLAFSGVPVHGVVIDRETEQPVPEAFVSARANLANPGPTVGSGRTGADGRFMLELDPGDYKLIAAAQGYAGETSDLTVGMGGVPDLRVAVSRGGSITGRVVDGAGRPLGGITVSASAGPEGFPGQGAMARSLPDGSFRMDGLAAGTFVVMAQSDLGAFALRTGVALGQEGLTLTLRPGGRVQVLVRGPDGAPVQHAYVRVTRASGAIIGVFMGQGTMGDGLAEVASPPGTVELEARKDKLKGTAVVEVASGATAAAEITLADTPAVTPGR